MPAFKQKVFEYFNTGKNARMYVFDFCVHKGELFRRVARLGFGTVKSKVGFVFGFAVNYVRTGSKGSLNKQGKGIGRQAVVGVGKNRIRAARM